ncbi:MAG TPA: SUMF1/EgtB/PvdO family nonheme iron enzyme [Anaerolineales bacterium]|nr:SUMF1/EgtB/PvdO family nonheme iron enzyme [Anaerolineales bacterium]
MTTFISYSRAHSEFVVHLAKDLKSAGFDVWLDQLDIPKGARWDDAIEAAVERSSTFMIVLTPESIESQNVKDELSYAIDSGKNILPVVIKPCKIPLRLRRFQFVDFTDKPYKESLSDIKRLLSNTQRRLQAYADEMENEAEPSLSSPGVTGPLIKKEPEFSNESLRGDTSRKANSAGRFIVPAIVAALALVAAVAAWNFFANQNAASPPSTDFTVTSSAPAISATATPNPAPVEIIDEARVTMRLVSAGDFMMGSDHGMEDEKPAQTVFLDTAYVDKYEVTNAFYRVCVEAGTCEPPAEQTEYFDNPEFDNYPVVNVNWEMAKTYCEWRSARLPTEAEWEKAARGTDGRTYPWGEEISCNEANFFGCEGNPASVSSLVNGRSVYGLYHMAGNVYEWVSSLYKAYPYDRFDGREDLSAAGERVIRGGSWLNSDTENEVRTARRHMADPTTFSENIGFRCAFSAAIPETGALLTITPLNGVTGTHVAATIHSVKTREARAANSTSTLSVGTAALTPQPSAITTPRPGTTATSGAGAPVTEPPVTEPPVTEPPVTEPPVTEPPVTEPPVTEPPVTEPPVTEPPVEPPPTDPPVEEPPPPTEPIVEPPPPTAPP